MLSASTLTSGWELGQTAQLPLAPNGTAGRRDGPGSIPRYGQAHLYALMAALRASCVLLTRLMLQIPFLELLAQSAGDVTEPGLQLLV